MNPLLSKYYFEMFIWKQTKIASSVYCYVFTKTDQLAITKKVVFKVIFWLLAGNCQLAKSSLMKYYFMVYMTYTILYYSVGTWQLKD